MIALRTTSTPVASSSATFSVSSTWRAFKRPTPPPGRMPSSTAARVAERASSTRCFFSLSSTSVEAPTFTTATPPTSLACLSWSFSRSKSEVVSSIWALICLILALISSSEPLPSTRVVLSLSEVTRRARPRSSTVTESSLRPTSSEITLPPVRIAISSSMALRLSPKPGALTPSTLIVPRSLFTTRVASASPSMSSATMSRFLETWRIFSSAGRISETAEIFLSVIRI